eukprot:CAMPEP_0202923636 /NCGR_PEP_ID=MMETSP1392-20130828/78554_1 /ASSEMBLY_ACC=CAM_ASM_000868 /TAXON_ID=225041 /ORGANISM="Chlamydomonas chlamydogama, Strain SAG 11-48b" /LENGTH=560 /DNA_ID=CAMNT_0049617329 /DNA_START=341 /DNA_END=2023 /DNA_ORIENTATION=+
MTWVLITSELGYYSKWFGPQILLELNFAFYLPSIPVLIISGQVEKLLDQRFGPISSMMIRLNVGLAGSAAICVAFPFVTTTHSALLWITAILGTLSAIAFSTSYQLVQWFRHADIIGLGIGGVGSGPLVLVIQLGLGFVGALPQRWQWIAMFEVTAFFVLLGLGSSLSLFGQYWRILTGEQAYVDDKAPLLSNAHGDTEAGGSLAADSYREEEEEEERKMALASATTENVLLTPDPFVGLPVMFQAESSASGHDYWGGAPPVLLPRSKSMDDSMVPIHHEDVGRHAAVRFDSMRREARRGVGGHDPASRRATSPAYVPASASQPQGSTATSATTSGSGAHTGLVSAFAAASQVPAGTPEEPGQAPAGAAEAPASRPAAAQAGPPLTLAEETSAALAGMWPVLVAFLISVTVTYVIFPFFTYIPSSGVLGDGLPRVLFFTRIGADILGRFSPRIKSLMVRSPPVLLSLALGKLVVAALLLVYIKLPSDYLHDVVPVAMIIFLWFIGGYVNTSANILAPAMVEPHLCGRASALMALAFQVAHFAGLVLAAVLVFVLYGDVAG